MACVVMAAGEEDSQDSLSQEEAFLAETAQFTKFVVQLHYQLKQSKEIIVQGKGLTQSKIYSRGIHSSPVSAPVSEPVSEQQIDPAAAQCAEKLTQVAEKYKDVLDGLFDGYFRGGRSTWDITYIDFRRICTSMLRATVNAVADRREQILLVIANCSYICEELKNAGGDTHRQNEFVNHVGRYLVEHGFQPWIREQGGWDKMVGSSVDTTAPPIDLSDDTPE